MTYAEGTAGVWAHDFGTYHETIPGQTRNGAHATNTSVTSQPTMGYSFVNGQLAEKPGPPVTFSGYPEPLCGPPKDDPAFVGMTPYAGGQLVLDDGTHLVTTMYAACAPGKPRNGGIHLFTSPKGDGYNFTFKSHVARQSDSPSFAYPAEGPNEHTVTLLPTGVIVCVFRTAAGDATGRYGPYYQTRSTDSGSTWSTATPLRDVDGNYIGCARPHMVQLGSVILLAGGRMMMGHDYSRAFSVWMSTDGGLNWTRADGSYHHNARAQETGAPLWPASCNRTGWRFEFTSGYIGLVRVGPSSAAVLYDLMLPPPVPPRPPPAPPAPPGVCGGTIHIHHTLGCFNYTGWHQPAGAGPVLPGYQHAVEGHADLESCAAACYLTNPAPDSTATAGMLDGKHCFCGTAAELGSAAAQALSVPRSQCIGVPCEASASETECGGAATMLAYAFTCDRLPVDAADAADTVVQEFHNPSTSFSMRIDLL